MATPRNSVEHRFRVVDYGRYPLFLQRFWLNLVPFGPDLFSGRFLLCFPLFLLFAFGSACVEAGVPFIDLLSADQFTITPTGTVNPRTQTNYVTDASSILGTQRDVTVVRDFGTTSSARNSVSIGGSTLFYTEASGHGGYANIDWDGSDSSAALNPTGLGAQNFLTGCASGDQQITFSARPSAVNNVALTLQVYTNGTNWSTATKTLNADSNEVVQTVTFDYSSGNTDFSIGGGIGANFGSVGAIRLTLNPNGTGTVFLITSPLTSCSQDYADAPATYGTLRDGTASSEGASGAGHVPLATLYLGDVAPDTELDGIPGISATGDDVNQALNDEECLDSLVSPGDGTATANIRVFNNTGNSVNVCGWLDTNVDGIFEQTVGVEQSCTSVGSSASVQDVALEGFSGFLKDQEYTSYACFRVCISESECNTPYGLASDGEVEDHVFEFDFRPTRAIIGDVSIDALTPDAALASLLGDADPNNAAALAALLAALDPDLAAALASADGATLRAALIGLLDPDGDGLIALLKWETLSEDGTIGFYVERLAPGGDWTRLNADLLPGLIVSAGGGDYALIDPDALSGQTLQYRLIEQEATGDQRTYGPYEVRMTPAVSLAANAAGSSARAGRLSKAKATETATSATPWQGLSEGFIGRTRAPAFTKTMEKKAAAEARAIDASPVSTAAAQTTAPTQWLYTPGAGLYRLTAAELAGLTGKSLNQVRTALKLGSMVNLSNSGRPAPWIYDPASDALLFSALDYRDLYTDQDAFRLSVSGAASRAMPRVSGGGPKAGQPGGVVMDRIRLEQDVFYKPDIIRDDVNADYWFQDYLYPNLAARREISVPINLPGLVPGGGEADLAIRLHGQTEVLEGDDHDVSLWFDGSRIASAQWDGPAPATITAHLDSAQLAKVAAGTRLVLKGARMNTLQWLDCVDVTYPRALRADDGKLLLRDLPRGVYTVSGFDGRAIRVIQAPGTAAARWRDNVTIRQGTDGWQVSFSVWQNADVLLVADESIAAPSAIVADEPKVLRHRRNQADYLIIAPHSLAETAEALRAWRAQSFSKVEIAWLSDIEQEFGNGRPGARAVDAFLEYVAGNWRSAPETVTIVGRATLDHRNLMGYGNSMIPVPMVATPWGLVPSDFAYSQVGDSVRFALGRIPVVDDAEGLTYIAKIQAAEAATPGVAASTAVVVADNPDDAGDFHANGNELGIALGSKGYGVRNLYRCILGETDPACTNVRTALTTSATWEAALVNFSGHGALMQLGDGTEKFLQVGDVAGLRNATQPVFAGMTCLVGGNAYPQWRSLTETLVLREGGGAIAALAPSGQSIDGDAHRMNLTFVDALTAGASIGEAARDTVNENQGAVLPFMKEIYQVTGEPAMRLP